MRKSLILVSMSFWLSACGALDTEVTLKTDGLDGSLAAATAQMADLTKQLIVMQAKVDILEDSLVTCREDLGLVGSSVPGELN